MFKDHSDSEKGNPLPPHRLLLSINSTCVAILLYAPSHRQDNTYHGLCYTSRGALAGARNSSMGPPHEGSIDRTMSERSTSELRPPQKQLNERNILFNDDYMSSDIWFLDYSDSERGDPLAPHGLLFLISNKDYFI